jgi:hypothetical protein
MPPFPQTAAILPQTGVRVALLRIPHPLALALGLVALLDVGSALLSLVWV